MRFLFTNLSYYTHYDVRRFLVLLIYLAFEYKEKSVIKEIIASIYQSFL